MGLSCFVFGHPWIGDFVLTRTDAVRKVDVKYCPICDRIQAVKLDDA